MLNINEVKPGQRVTVSYVSPVEWGKVTDNPFRDLVVTKRMSICFTAAGANTYGNMAEKLDHERSGKPSWHEPALAIGPCVRQHKSNGSLYLAGINHDITACQYFIGNEPATNEQVKQIESFLKPSRETERGLDFKLWTLEKLANAVIQWPVAS